MPRNASGTYSLPSGNPVSSGTLIDSNWANNTLNDLANEVTDSLSRSAEGGMLAPLRLTDGVQATPSLAFTNEPSTGLYRAGTNEAWFVTGGNQVAKFTSTGMEGRFAAGAAATPSLAAYNDVNTGLWFPAADTIAASTGGSERLRLDSSGNVGIGTASPTYRLDLQSSTAALGLRLKGGSGTNQGSVLLGTYAGSSSTFYGFGDRAALFGGTPDQLVSIFTGSTALTFDINGGEKARIDSSGNLGIGTSSPITKLDVRSDAAVVATSGYAGWHFNALPASATARAATIRKNYDSPFDFNIYASTGTSGNSAATIFYRDITNESMRLDSSGNLGIGTAIPSYRLDLQGASGVGMQIFETSTGNNNRLIITQNGIVSKFNNTFSSGFGAFAWEIGGVERMRLDDSGNLGIGTASPTYRLDVVGASTIAARFKGNGTLSAVVLSDNNTVTEGYVGSVGDDIRIVAGTQEVVRARSSGNVTAGLASRATTATDGFLYVPTCAGTPTGTPTAITGFAPIVVNTTNNKLYFYSGGAWRDAGP